MTRTPVWRAIWVVLGLGVAGAAFVVGPEPRPPVAAGGAPFAWRRDDLWRALEAGYVAGRGRGCAALDAEIRLGLASGRALLERAAAGPRAPADQVFDRLEAALFALAPGVAACPAFLPEYARLVTDARAAVKLQSRSWDLAAPASGDRLYRALQGSRAALEEAMLQAPPAAVPSLLVGTDEPSRTPAARMLGLTVHSGDLLVSRGGVPVSALIARGSDHPGVFSHVALLHVDETGRVSMVEAHIERGVAVATVEGYLADVKLRILVLRPRSDLPALVRDPLLPHRAAEAALSDARSRHIPYDFAMDGADPGKLFCSEVAAAAYRTRGVELWRVRSLISSPGVASWLGAFGVRHFATEEPSDLEADPQLTVVGEWRDPDVLFHAHVDDAVTDALLEQAERGRRLHVSTVRLPLARAAKAWSAALNLIGKVGPVPEGMSATSALRSEWFTAVHRQVAGDVAQRAERFRAERGYRPPYWVLVDSARESCAARLGAP